MGFRKTVRRRPFFQSLSAKRPVRATLNNNGPSVAKVRGRTTTESALHVNIHNVHKQELVPTFDSMVRFASTKAEVNGDWPKTLLLLIKLCAAELTYDDCTKIPNKHHTRTVLMSSSV